MTAFDLIVLVACVALSFFFSGIETGLLSLNKIRLRHRTQRHDPRALVLQQFMERPEHLLATVLVGNNLVNIAATALAAEAALRHWPQSPVLAMTVAVLVMTMLLFIIGELLPKSLFRLYPFRLSMALAVPLQWCSRALTPLTVAFTFLATALMRLAGEERQARELFVTREELLLLAREDELGAKLSPEERTMISGVFEMCATPVRDVMVPLAQVLAVTPQTSAVEILRQARERNIARMPVLDAAGNLAGIVSIYDILCSDADPVQKTALEFCQPALIVDAGELLDRVLVRLRGVNAPMAVVADAKQRAVGVVTVSDLVEKIVGEIEM